ncbi:MAG: chorismate mutase [Spirochaetia bacterium]|nr:chorismate mutase [Spirochaetia bacterium]
MKERIVDALRGAICVSSDTSDAIDDAVKKLYENIMEKNHLETNDLAFILFTQTGDLRSRNPAAALRASGHGNDVPLFCMQELEIEGMLERVIRIMIVTNVKIENPRPVYMDGAQQLRPEFKF